MLKGCRATPSGGEVEVPLGKVYGVFLGDVKVKGTYILYTIYTKVDHFLCEFCKFSHTNYTFYLICLCL